MRIASYLPLSLCDYPAHVASVAFTQGCNYRCPWCHNKHLVPLESPDAPVSEDDVIAQVQSRIGKIQGLVVSGGEPTLQSDLPHFLDRVKSIGLLTKLDTNGSNPDMVRQCLSEGLVDFIAMDVKAPWGKYDALAGADGFAESVRQTMEMIASSGVAHQFRTTRVNSLLCEADFDAIEAQLPAGEKITWQAYRPVPGCE